MKLKEKRKYTFTWKVCVFFLCFELLGKKYAGGNVNNQYLSSILNILVNMQWV